MSDSGDDPDGIGGEGLQVELFHAETDREPGDTNKQFSIGSTRVLDVHPQVFSISAVIILAFIALSLAFPDQATELYSNVRKGISNVFGWFFILVVNVFIIFMIYLALSKYGNIRLGGVDADKEFSDISWVAMLFSAGMGIGLMFFGVAEPVWHFFDPHLGAESATPEAAQVAMAVSLYHWGFHPWAIYALVGLSLAFFSFNRGLPLTFRSIFWPVLGERIYGWPGHIIDILTVFATLFGLTTSLGLGALQINAGLNFIGNNVGAFPAIPNGTLVQVGIIAGVTAVAVVSVAAGLDGGVRRLSNLNLLLMFTLLGTVIVLGPTLFVFGMIPQGLGQYFSNFFDLAFFSGAVYDPYFAGSPYYGPGGDGEGAFLVDWTVFYWAWWIAWSPFVGMFIARISKGRTVREFISGVLILPVLFSVLWFAALGGSALSIELGSGAVSAAMFAEGVDVPRAVALFAMLDTLPGTIILSLLSVLLVSTFFITSSDSGSLVIDHLTSGGKHDAPVAMRVFWAITEGIVAATLLVAGATPENPQAGLEALQAAAISTGLPFAFILVFMMYAIWKGLGTEYEVLESQAFQDRVEEMAEEGEIVIDRTGGEVVTDITAGEEEPGD
ncbi:glycine/betaine ABC transporter [Halobacteriales archaeon QH_7_69_31]|nr:MAG: glycine/betaine ABC transporter [Halobacteriales archaeon QH_7_69_31]